MLCGGSKLRLRYICDNRGMEIEDMNHSFFFEYGEMLAKFCLCFDDTLSAHSHTLNTYHL